MAFEFNEEKQVYIVNGTEIPKAAYEAVHSEGANGTNRRVKQMLSTLYPDQDPKEFEKMTIRDVAEFIGNDRAAILKKAQEKPAEPPKPSKSEDVPDIKLVLAQKEAELEKSFAQKLADLKKKSAIDELRQTAIGLGLREDLRDPDVFAAFVRKRYAVDDASLSAERVRWLDAQKDQVAIGSDGKEATAETLAKALAQAEPNSFVTRKIQPGPAGKIAPGVGATSYKDIPTEQLLAMDE